MPAKKKTTKATSRRTKKVPRQVNAISKLKGMKDILPEDSKYWKLVTKKAIELSKVYSFQRIETPILESTSLFEKAYGKTSNLINKETLSFTDKKGDKLTLRADAVPGLVRAGLEHNIFAVGKVFKSFWLGPIFKYDQNQAGRLRQTYQFSLDVFGNFGPTADAQLILIGYNFFKELQVEVEVQINSMGCPECRKEYIEKLLECYKERGKKSKLCDECRKQIAKDPMQLLNCKDPKCMELACEIPPTVDHLCTECRDYFVKVLEHLDSLSIPYNLNHHLVSTRGYDSYNKTIFEFAPLSEAGKYVALGGGGNYSQLSEDLGSKGISACGLGIDIEKTISRIRSNNIAVKNGDSTDVFVAQLSESAKHKAMLIFEELRRAGFKARECFVKDNLKDQLEEAENSNARYTLILGQKELQDNMILIRDMESGAQEFIDIKKIINELDKRLNIG
ncbi:MAG: histidine--tRNA ligase [bacterium]